MKARVRGHVNRFDVESVALRMASKRAQRRKGVLWDAAAASAASVDLTESTDEVERSNSTDLPSLSPDSGYHSSEDAPAEGPGEERGWEWRRDEERRKVVEAAEADESSSGEAGQATLIDLTGESSDDEGYDSDEDADGEEVDQMDWDNTRQMH